MPVRVACSQCNKTLTLKDEFAGKRIRCPGCQNILQVPAITTISAAPLPAKTPATPAAKAPWPSPAPAPKPATPAPATDRPQRTASAPRTGYIPSVSQDATVMMKSLGTPCPSCGKNIPPGEQSCPSCKYHLKLRRKLGLSTAIQSADMHTMGLNADGSKKVTRAELTEDRVEKQRKLNTTALIVAGVVALIAGLVVTIFLYRNLRDNSVPALRTMLNPAPVVADKPETFSAFWISMPTDEPLTLTIPADEIELQKPKFPTDWPRGNAGWAAFAQAVQPPLATAVNHFAAEDASPIIERAEQLGGSYAPSVLGAGAPEGDLFIWRKSPAANQSGYLRGVILDFGKEKFRANEIVAARQSYEDAIAKREKKIKQELMEAESFGKKMTRAEAEAKIPMPAVMSVRLSGKLSFVTFFDYDLHGGMGSYRSSAENNSPAVRRPEDIRPREAKDLPRRNFAYFAPVLLIDSVEVVKAASGPEKKSAASH